MSVIFTKPAVQKAKTSNPEIELLMALLTILPTKRGVISKLTHVQIPSSKKSHFQNEAKCEAFVVKMSFICIIIKNHFHINGFALSLVLKVRFFGTRKWPNQYGFHGIKRKALCAASHVI